MADQNVQALVDALLKNAQAKAPAKKPKQEIQLPAGYKLDPSGSVFNPGLDKRIPLGIVTYVYDQNNNVVGYAQGNKFTSFAEDLAQKSIKFKEQDSVNAFNEAQKLSADAKTQYEDAQRAAKYFAQGSTGGGLQGLAYTKDDVARAAQTYLNTINKIKAAYQQSGLVQGEIHLDQNGQLAPGTVYQDPKNPSQQVTVGMGGEPIAQQTQPESAAALGLSSGQLAGKEAIPTPSAGTPNVPGTGSGKGAGAGAGAGGGNVQQLDRYYSKVGNVLKYNGTDYTGYYKDQYYENGVLQTADQTTQDFLNKYGTQMALIQAEGLGDVFTQAMKENWGPDKWKLAYQQSAWYQSHGSAYRDSETAKTMDAGGYAESYNNLLKQIQIQAQSEGYDVSPFGGIITADQVKTLDPNSPMSYLLQNYWNTPVPADVLSKYIANHATIAKTPSGVAGGTLASTANDLKSYAASLGVHSSFLTPSWSNAVNTGDYWTNAADAIQKGLTTTEAEKNLYKQQAMALYKPFASAINDGATLASAANPWISAVSNLLEISPDQALSSLGANNGYGSILTKALQGDGTNATDLYTLQNQIRGLPQWLDTNNAKTSIMDSTNQLLKNFGLVTQ